MSTARFVIATPGHGTIYDYEALALQKHGLLRFVARGTRRGVTGLQPEFMRRRPSFGLLAYVAARTMSTFHGESFRFRLHPWFDRWVRRQLQPGDHLISSYGYANSSFEWTRAHGGKTFVDAGNSHPDNFWKVLSEEQRRWNSPYPPVARHHYERSMAMMPHVDYVLSASSYVTRTFLERGFAPERILPHPRPINLSSFKPPSSPRPADRPLTVMSTGTLCLRKGSPYLFESFRLIRKQVPDARFILRRIFSDDFKQLASRYNDVPVTWLEHLPEAGLGAALQQADIFLLPSLEDGLALTVVEALACGLPVITTPNTGASELIEPDITGDITPIRDPQAMADAVIKWSRRILSPDWHPRSRINPELLTLEHFEKVFIGQLEKLGLAG